MSVCFVSIHAPAWGATQNNQEEIQEEFVSIHAPAWGATDSLIVKIAPPRFQSTRPRGARH